MPEVHRPAGLSFPHRELVLATFAEAIWRTLTSLPSLGLLPGVIFTEIDKVIRALASGRLVAVGGDADTAGLVRFAGQGGFEGFQVELAGAIVVRLEGRLGPLNSLDLITRLLPAALAGTLAAQPAADGTDRYETYRLVGASMAGIPAPAPAG